MWRILTRDQGDTFLKNYYSTYSYTSPSKASVDFAKAV